ncbi:hypothetical protein WJ96_07735 [Burkholderia ubonensis]|uniref:ATP-grasp domain-containing protein n=1 Tax=Burkholderia ubonensis TaxID=101571 RepID=A0AAW3MWW1_9BURK|nr:ATP-grasp domain-containing protein [Burkholderia ubonensis]KVP75591.1 hypothetical protein WJ93_09535 [Burkholderia ubonensis]KVP98403.1 hypothetical protein WJ96_07735 [Burkholderia ubonensis]KVZ93102.1 hypothetical protein WL25_19400 [Burkholderia ubonensis]
MLWLLQNNYVDRMTGKLAFALRNRERLMHDFSLVPGEPLPELPLRPSEPHFFYGSTGLVQRLIGLPGWTDGVFLAHDSLDQRVWLQHRRADMLNPTCEVMTLTELESAVPAAPFFVRPVMVQKAFAGQVVRDRDLSGLYQGRHGVLKEPSPELLVALSPLQDIESEYRFVVYRHRVVTGSRYRQAGQMSLSAGIPHEILTGANALAEGWLPHDFIVMDVAQLPNGRLCIIEFNSVHSSGLYDTPMEQFIAAVERAVRERA